MRPVTIDKKKEWTAEDYLLLEEASTLNQIINGELVMSPSPSPLHQIISSNLNDLLKKEAKKLGGIVFYAPIDLYVNKHNVFQPDLIYISKEKKGIISKRGIEGVPDLVVEIISPSNSYVDRYEKKDAYKKFGVPEFWIVDPANETLEIYSGSQWEKPSLYLAASGKVKSVVLNELGFNLTDVFNP
jgi:Uma2 family endonuclease